MNQHGLVTFNGPSILAGFAQMRHLPSEFSAHVKSILMEPEASYEYKPFSHWANNYVDWNTPDYDGETSELREHDGWRWLQGSSRVEGRLFGGCIEVLEFMKATPFWPSLDFFDGRILFFETSEDKPSVSNVKYMLRNYGSMGALDRVKGVLFGRARSYTPEEKEELYRMLVRVVADEFGRPELPIVANLDFGHTDPQFVMPLGVKLGIDCVDRHLTLQETAVS